MAATNSPLCSEMHHSSCSHGRSSFFKQVADGDVADGLDVAELRAPLRDEAQRPPGVALGRLGAGQGHDLRLGLSVYLPVAGAVAPLPGEHAVEAALHELALQVVYRLGRRPSAAPRSSCTPSLLGGARPRGTPSGQPASR